MKIAVIDTTGARPELLAELLQNLRAGETEVHLFVKALHAENAAALVKNSGVAVISDAFDAAGFVEETAPHLARRINEIAPDVCLIWDSNDIGWVALPMLRPETAIAAIGHDDAETYYLPARHYRSFVNRLIGVSPEVCIGFVLSSVVEKECVEWIPFAEPEDDSPDANLAPVDFARLAQSYIECFERAQKDNEAALRTVYDDFPLMETVRSRLPLWLRKLKARIAG